MKKDNILLEVKNLHKTYWKEKVLNWIDFTMWYWEVLGYIWPNGAWKTTTIKILLWINEADNGSNIKIEGKDVDTIKKDNIISYLPEKINLPEYMSWKEYLNYIIELSDLKTKVNENKILETINLVKFPLDYFNKKIKTYSKWMQQRLWLASILLNPNNRLIILDEPVSWLDPIWQDEMIEIIDNLKKQWKSIFITTHELNEVERLCDTVCFVKKWKIENKDSLKNILEKYNSLIEYYKTFYSDK